MQETQATLAALLIGDAAEKGGMSALFLDLQVMSQLI